MPVNLTRIETYRMDRKIMEGLEKTSDKDLFLFSIIQDNAGIQIVLRIFALGIAKFSPHDVPRFSHVFNGDTIINLTDQINKLLTPRGKIHYSHCLDDIYYYQFKSSII